MVGHHPEGYIYKVMLKIQDQIEQEVHEMDNDLVIAFLQGINETDQEIDKWIRECINPEWTTINTIPAGEHWVKNKMTQSQYLASHEAQQRKKMDVESLVPKEFHDFIPTVFSEQPVGKLPTSKKYDHAIDLKPDFVPKAQKPFCLSPKEEEAITKFINENLKKGFIQPSTSDQASALFFVPKTDMSL